VTELLSPFLANVIGMIGSAMMVAAYAYSNFAKKMNFTLFNLVNLIGSLLLITSLTVHLNMGAMAMEIVWAVIAVLGLIKAVRA
jgi:hypothetical protein